MNIFALLVFSAFTTVTPAPTRLLAAQAIQIPSRVMNAPAICAGIACARSQRFHKPLLNHKPACSGILRNGNGKGGVCFAQKVETQIPRVEQPKKYFQAVDKTPIFYNEWKPSDKPIARVIAIPGLGDHIRRYSELFEYLNAHGIYVQGMDPRGFGQTVGQNEGEKGYSRFKDVFSDILEFAEQVGDSSLPTFLYGHSLGKYMFNYQGGIEILAFTQKFADKVPNYRGTIASSPALGTLNGVSLLEKIFLGAVNLTPFGSRIQHKNPVDPTDGGMFVRLFNSGKRNISAEVDPNPDLNHSYVTFGLLKDTTEWMEWFEKNADKFTVPVLVAHAVHASSEDKTLLTFEQQPVRHALHLDMGVREVFFKTVEEWITARVVGKK